MSRATAAIVVTLALVLPARARADDFFTPGDPLGFTPLELSGIYGPLWMGAAVGLSLGLSRHAPRPHRVYASTDVGWFRSIHSDRTDVLELRFGLGGHPRRWFSWGGELLIATFAEDRVTTGGAGGWLYARWHPGRWPNGTFWFEYGVGMIFTLDPFPPHGTRFNFTPTYGLGGRVRLHDRLWLRVEVRHRHVSNANLGDGNPGFDSNGIVLGSEVEL